MDDEARIPLRLARPLDEAVISSYIAFQLKKWHFFGEVDSDARATLDALAFHDNVVWEEHIRFLADKIIIDHVASTYEIPAFEYATVRDNVGEIVASLRSRMQIDGNNLKRGSAKIPIPTRNESSIYGEFTERLGALLERRGSELEARTIKRLCERTSLKRQAAERLVSESMTAS